MDATFCDYQNVTQVAKKNGSSTYTALSPQKIEVVIKVFDGLVLNDALERDLFLREAAKFKQLQLFHCLPLLDYGFADNQPYVVTVYQTNGSLRDRLKRFQLPPEEAVDMLLLVGDIVVLAHAIDILHGNLKPENVLFNEYMEPILADFSIPCIDKKMQESGYRSDSYAYIAPEYREGGITKASDQYALGCLAYELLTGIAPFSPWLASSSSLKEGQERLAQFTPQTPASIEATVLKAIAKKPADRHTDVQAFLAALTISTSATVPVLSSSLAARMDKKRDAATFVSNVQEDVIASSSSATVATQEPAVPITVLETTDAARLAAISTSLPTNPPSTFTYAAQQDKFGIAPAARRLAVRQRRKRLWLGGVLIALCALFLFMLFPSVFQILNPIFPDKGMPRISPNKAHVATTSPVRPRTPTVVPLPGAGAVATPTISPTAAPTPIPTTSSAHTASSASTHAGGAPPIVVPTPVPPAPVANGPGFSFEDGLPDGWDSPGQQVSNMGVSTAQAKNGTHSLVFHLTNTDTTIYPYVSSGQFGLSPPLHGQTVTAYVYVASGSSFSGWLYVMDNNYGWLNGPQYKLVPGQWTRITLVVTMNNLIRLGVQFGGAVNTDVYIDAVSWS